MKVLEAWCKETKVHGEIDDGDDDDTNISDSYDYAKIPARYEELKLENIELMEKLTASKAVEESLSQRLESTMYETDGLKDEAKTALMKSSEMQKMTNLSAISGITNLTKQLAQQTKSQNKLSNVFGNNTELFTAIEVCLKGIKLDLPDGVSYEDKDGIRRHNVRCNWWDKTRRTFNTVALASKKVRNQLSDKKIPEGTIIEYTGTKPIFFGHYWYEQEVPQKQTDYAACLDYSIASDSEFSKLVAYRLDDSPTLLNENFIFVKKKHS